MTATESLPTRDLSMSGRFRAYLGLTKPRIIELLLVTTVPTMFLAAGGFPPVWTMIATLIGGALAAGGANTLNSYLDLSESWVEVGKEGTVTGFTVIR